jgi:predicted DNA-binding protein (MmcQ/YjbR family)
MKSLVCFIILLSLGSCQEDVRFNNPSFQGLKDNVFESGTITSYDRSKWFLIIKAYTGNEVVTLKTTSTTKQTLNRNKHSKQRPMF